MLQNAVLGAAETCSRLKTVINLLLCWHIFASLWSCC